MAPKKKPEEEEEVEEDPGPPPVEEGNGVFIFPDSTKFGAARSCLPPCVPLPCFCVVTMVCTDGQWQKGGELGEDFRRHGQGTHIDGEQSYEGQWCNDAMHGHGTFRYASNAVYEGLWANNQYEGEGKYSWPNGASYTVAKTLDRLKLALTALCSGGVGGQSDAWQGRIHRRKGCHLARPLLQRCRTGT